MRPDQGPEDVDERDTEKALYAGEPKRYKNYSYRLLCFFVNQDQPGATPLTCSEAVFEDALQKTTSVATACSVVSPQLLITRALNAFRNETVLLNLERISKGLALPHDALVAHYGHGQKCY